MRSWRQAYLHKHKQFKTTNGPSLVPRQATFAPGGGVTRRADGGLGGAARSGCLGAGQLTPSPGAVRVKQELSCQEAEAYFFGSFDDVQLCDLPQGLVLQRLVHPGVEDQWLQLGTVYQRDDLTQHDQVIAGAVRLPQPTVERRRRVDQNRAAGYAWFEGHSVEHRRANRAVPVGEPARDVLLSGGEHVDDEPSGPLDQAEAAAGLIEADQHEHRVERHRREGVDRHAVHVAIVAGHGDDGDSGRERAHRLAEGAHVDGRGGGGGPPARGPGRGYRGGPLAGPPSPAPPGAAARWARPSLRGQIPGRATVAPP